MTVIYVLRRPITGETRYVGKSIAPDQRLRNHISCAKRGAEQHSAKWIRSLLAEGLRPILEVIEEVPDGESWEEYEKRAIAAYREAGHRLTNITVGGGGAPPGPWTQEAIARLAESIKASWQNPETRARYLEGMNAPDAIARRAAASRKRAEDPAYIAALSAYSKRPEQVAKLIQVAAIARLDPEFEPRRAAAIKRGYENPQAKANLAAAMVEVNARPDVNQARSETMLAHWADPVKREEFVAAKRKPETRAKMSESAKRGWDDPEIAKRKKDARWTPEAKLKMSESSKIRNADPVYQATRALMKAERKLAKLKAEAEDRASRLL